jgi:hypothetical protein
MKIGFLEEAEGRKSAVRLIFVYGSFWNMALCSYLVLNGAESGAIIATFTAIEASLGFAKLGQKHMENQNKK